LTIREAVPFVQEGDSVVVVRLVGLEELVLADVPGQAYERVGQRHDRAQHILQK
jgi:hypothetical protein